MKCKELFNEIEKLNSKYIDMWQEFCNMESPTAYKEGVDKCGAYVVDWAKDMGFEVEVCHQEKAGDVICITMNPHAKEQPFCISGHMDTVHPVGLFGTPAVKMDEEKIYGPGVTDCKGGIVAGMLSMEALKNTGFETRPVILLLQTDEEVGSKLSGKKTIEYICGKSEGAIGFLNLEGYTAHKGVIARKGILTLEFRVKGIKAHSAACALGGANAIAEAAHKIIEMEKLKDDGGVTCNCGIISGGTVVNTVPDECVFRSNIRFVSQKEYDEVMVYAKEVCNRVHVEGCTCEMSVVGYRPAMELTKGNEEFLEFVNSVYRENEINELEAFFARGGSDAAYVTIAGIPCVDSLGVEGGNIHTENEFAYIKSLAESAKRIASVIQSI